MEYYALTKRQLQEELNSTERGLTSQEAEKRLHVYGKNLLKEGKKTSLLSLFFAQFKDLMTVILICAAFLSAVLAFITKDVSQLADTGILLFIILLNAVVGFLQQYRADAAIEKLKKLSVCYAKVLRDGKVVQIDASELVPGDVIELAEGDRIPADCRILWCEQFRCDESALTGESSPVKKKDTVLKKAALAERENLVHLSTFCISGSARCMVVATGMESEMGKIAGMLAQASPVPSPLDKTIAKLGKLITITVLSVASILFLGGLFAQRVSFLENIMSAVAVAVAAIPEGMGAVVTVILAMGVQRMARAKAVVRKLSAVETLGNCTWICTDKTGTLTQNKMTVEEIVCSFRGAQSVLPVGEKEMLACMRVCHSVKGEQGHYLGDPTEVALLEYADSRNFTLPVQVIAVNGFTSERKRMSVCATVCGKMKTYVKGSAEVLLQRCTRLLTPTGERTLTEQDCVQIRARISRCSARAMRILAFACADGELREEELTFLGFAAMFDPPKAGAKEAVALCRNAGIRISMITGDSAETAYAIARRLGIAERREQVITGEALDALGEEFSARAAEYTVYARVSPKHKTEIVRALQKRGEVVAMTGDGVNDAPSIRTADIGVAMGSGTDVTKNAADMVISDDDFATIARAAEEGRNVFYNVKKTIAFFLSTNFAEVLAVLVVSLFLWKYEFLTSTQLLWINLITDSLPVLALGVERTEGAMNGPPVSAGEIFGKRSLFTILCFGVVQAAIAVGVFLFSLEQWGNGVASTAAFFTMSFLELLYAFNVRKERSPLGWKGLIENKTLLFTAAIGIAVNVLLAIVPAFSQAFRLTPLSGVQWGMVFLCSISILPIGELFKWGIRLKEKFSKRKKCTPVSGNVQ